MSQVFTNEALAGQIVLVTGASRGIGEKILARMVQAGATVVGTATSESGAQKITEQIAALGGKGRGVVLNVTDAAACDAVLADITKEFGAVTVLVNNAGITRDGFLVNRCSFPCSVRLSEAIFHKLSCVLLSLRTSL